MSTPKDKTRPVGKVAAVAPASPRSETNGPAVRVATDPAIGAAAGLAPVAGEGVAPTTDPASPDPVTDRPAVVVDAATNAAPAVVLERPNTDIGAFRQGHEGVTASLDGEHGKGTLVDGDRTEPLADLRAARYVREADADPVAGDRFGAPLTLRRTMTGFDLSELTAEDRAALVVELAPDLLAMTDLVERRVRNGRIQVSSAVKHRRAGFAFGPTPLDFAPGQLTAEQLRQIEADPLLTVKAVG